ncbi:a-pheromone processing metallopeptidase Ste23 [Purpureocillium lavendulum]|uniref:A-pheromone processing metallopeptidase Ste23 n=1 Tax=Purpureocillium lavendulum TaxID=1247861 RepID=A0AB34G4I8_9HYPO|nr:a-pheromone processing metallopeptidase Ste23 [Purpureocillium lavendulum]
MPTSQSLGLTPGRQAPVVLLTDRLEKPSLDDRDYRVVRLENDLEALLVHDPETDKASAALDVNVGNFSDEDGMPGMAHAVEHLLFMGTKKFPIENEYGQYLSANSGSSNAYTASTSTNYYFDVAAKPDNDEDPSDANPSPLREALDRFAQFFIEPLFLSNTLDRELRAVDSENKKNLQNDTWRLHQLEKSLSNPRHPYCHFSTGNFEVLKTIPESQGINVRDKFIEFHAKHYSANRMKLVVLGREPLDILQKWVVELFSPIVNKKLPSNRWTDEVPFRPEDLGMQCFAKPVMDSRDLNLIFPFIDEEALFESQPSRYISHLIGHEGPGSIMAYVKSKGWANSLSAGAYPVCPGTPGIFEVQIRMTEEGLKNYPEIVKIFFQYVSLLRESPPQEWIFDEQKGMADVDFKFRQKTPASRFTSRTSSVMQKPLPREWLLSGHSRLRTFDPKLIENSLDKIRPDNMRMVIVSRKFPGSWDKKEKWYGTEYTHEKIPADLMKGLHEAIAVSPTTRLSELHLPHKNNFIPNKLEVEKKDVAEPAPAPRLLRNDSVARTWWKKDDTFWVPKANVMVSLKNPIIFATAENSVKARLFTELIRDALEEYSYDAELAGLQYTVTLDSRGLELDISGYNDKLPVLLEQVAVTLRDLNIKDERFDIVKERLTRGYDNWQLQSSYQQVGEYMAWLNAERDFVVEELAVDLQNITADAVRLFHKQMLAQLYIEVYAHGNMYKGEALKVTDMVESILKPRILPRSQWPIIRSLVLPPGSNYVFNKTLKDPANVNHCVETFFFVADRSDQVARAKTLLIDQMVHEPAFDQLRTKEQLGYIVFSSMRVFATVCGFRFLVQSERTPEYLDRRIEAFLGRFGQTLDEMSDSEFEGHKRSLINKRLEKLRNLDQEWSRHWTHISNEYYSFDQAKIDAEHVKGLTKAEMVEFYNQFFSPTSNTRARISVHMHARGAGELDLKVIDLLQSLGLKDVPREKRQNVGLLADYLKDDVKLSESERESITSKAKELGLSQMTHNDEVGASATGAVSAVDSAQEITDVRQFKAGLFASLGARPVKDLSEFEETDAKLLARPTPSSKDPDVPSSPSPDSVLPSCEPDDDNPAFSFSAASSFDSQHYGRADSLPASSLPPRLQTQIGSLVSADYASSVASSSPCASAYAELSLESDRGGDDTASARTTARSQSPFRISRRAIMNGDAELPHRSSSPLKRRASNMEPEPDAHKHAGNPEGSTTQPLGDGSVPHGGFPRAMSVDAPEAGASGGADSVSSEPPPTLQEQVKIIETLLKAFAEEPVQEGSTAYLVSRSWVDKALALRADSKSSKMDTDSAPLGPVDNSDIIEEVIKESSGQDFVRLKPGSGLESFELFPEDAWKLVVAWYGIQQGQVAIVRTAVNTADSKQAPPNIMYEFHPPVFRVHRLWSEVSPLPIEQSLKAQNPPPVVIARSAATHAQSFLKELKALTGIPKDRKIRMFRLDDGFEPPNSPDEQRSALTPPDSPGRTPGQEPWSHLLLSNIAYSSARDHKKQVQLADQTMNDKFNGQAALQHYELNTDSVLILDEAIGPHWVSTYNGRDRIPIPQKSIPSRNAGSFSSKPNSNRSSPGRDGPLTRARAQKKRFGRNTGAVGMHNLGNTCYMNSALQCVRSVEELTKYFLTESYLPEINQTNVLGYEGRVASAYGSLLREIYEEGRGSVSPRDFKSTVGRCRPTFSGWGQQDSQEFLGFLLDALQEDLSRIKKKPYIEKPDSTDDMINDPDAIRKMADEVWDITRKRDDSVIADLFTGMYKSTLKCPECGKISITFDPFNNLTLPLPVQNMWVKAIKFFPLNDVPVKIEVELPKHSSVDALKQFISERTGVPAERLMGAEEFKDRFFKIYQGSHDISEEIQHTDAPTMHELDAIPTNWPSKAPRKKYRSMLDIDSPPESSDSEDEQCNTLVVPLLHRRPQVPGRGPDGMPPPQFITLNREEASSLDMIRRKVLEKVAVLTTWSTLADAAHESDNADSADGDMVVTTASDADSSGDVKVAARSVSGEEDMVDVTMRDAGDSHNPTSKILKRFNTRRPKFINPDTFLDPELQNLFDLSYFRSDSDGTVPTGWSSVDNTRTLPKLTDRIPEPKDIEDESPESVESTGSGNDDSSNEDEGTVEPAPTRMAEESSDEDANRVRFAGRPGRQHHKSGPGGRKKFKGHKTYGKKGNKRRDKQMRGGKNAHRAHHVEPQPMPPAVADGGPLVRLYEGLVVDWTEEAWEMVFGNTGRREDAAEGAKTYADVETLHDNALKLTQRRRQSRKNKGITLEECLDEFERAEVLSEQDMWYCPRCKEHRRASKKFDLWKTPDILVAHLKRFSSSGWRRDKLDVLVDFPIENLDLTSRVIQKENGKDEIYDLIAVDDHYGGLGGGHYTAYAKNFVDGRWYSFNDSSVHVVADPANVVTNAAYLLFYRRRSSKHLGGARFDEIFAKYDKESSMSDGEATESSEDGRGSIKTAVKQVDEDDDPPMYDGSIRRSIEDDGEEMQSGYQDLGSKSLDMTQGWSFDKLDGSGAEGSNAADCASDDAQFDSGDDRGQDPGDQDTDMASVTVDDAERWEGQDVLSVPAQGAGDRDSEEVAEIHLEGDKAGRGH